VKYALLGVHAERRLGDQWKWFDVVAEAFLYIFWLSFRGIRSLFDLSGLPYLRDFENVRPSSSNPPAHQEIPSPNKKIACNGL